METQKENDDEVSEFSVRRMLLFSTATLLLRGAQASGVSQRTFLLLKLPLNQRNKRIIWLLGGVLQHRKHFHRTF